MGLDYKDYNSLMASKRQIKKTVVTYNEEPKEVKEKRERSRSRDKEKPSIPISSISSNKIQEISSMSRRQRLQMMKRNRLVQQTANKNEDQIFVKIEQPINKEPIIMQIQEPQRQAPKEAVIKPHNPKPKEEDNQSQDMQQDQRPQIMMKPVFISKEYRDDNNKEEELLRQEQRKKRNNRYTTKLLLEENKHENSEQQNQETDSQNENQTDIPDDNDMVNQEYQFQLWKIRELKRIRRAQEEHRKYETQRKEIERRRQMTNEQIFVQNRALGSDATDNLNETKYVFMQKYYHRGAFYQDSDDEIFKRDYNLPTPMEMQDKSMLPQILQKRIGNFGKKGQSKYTHLTSEDTSDLNPLTRPDESLLEFWKKKTAGYKGSYKSNNL